MKKNLLLVFVALFTSFSGLIAQERTHPVSTARITGVDGKSELVFEEAISGAFTVNVLDITGKNMFSLYHDANDEACDSVELPINNLRKGIYMVQVVAADGKIKTLKLQRN